MQACPVPQVEEPVGPRVVVPAAAYPMGTKDRLDRRNQGTEGVAVTGPDVGNPTVMATLAFVVDFRQVVGPAYNLMHRSAPRWLHYRRSQIGPGREVAEQQR